MCLVVKYYGRGELIREKGRLPSAVWRVELVERTWSTGFQLVTLRSLVVSLAVWDGDVYDIYRSIETVKTSDPAPPLEAEAKGWLKKVAEEIREAYISTGVPPNGINDTAWKDLAPRVERGIYMDAGEVDVF